jgi:multidrug efflux system membrane fusion protein
MLIDDKAVMTDQDRKFVFVLGPEDKVKRKDVVLGSIHDGLRVVQSGLDANDKVIVAGLQKIFAPDTKVKPNLVAMGAPPQSGQPRGDYAEAVAGLPHVDHADLGWQV